MENKTITARGALFILAGAVVIICMVMNWFPVELNIGVVQLNEVFGKVNAFTLSKTVYELEETLGVLAGFLPQAFEELKIWSVVMAVCAAATVTLYVCGIAMRILRKERFVELVSLAAAAGAILTAVVFSSVITEICDAVGATLIGYSVISVLMRSPWLIVVLGGIVSAICMDRIADMIAEWLTSCIDALRGMATCVAEWIQVIIDNLGFLISDVIGAVVGLLAGRAITSMTDIVLLGVVAGLGVACLIAAVGCVIVSRIFTREVIK